MFGIGMPELLIIMAVALVVLGPKKLPDIAKGLAKGISEFKKATQEIKQNIAEDEDLRDIKNTFQEGVHALENDLADTTYPSASPGPKTALNDEDKDEKEEESTEQKEEEESKGMEEAAAESLDQEAAQDTDQAQPLEAEEKEKPEAEETPPDKDASKDRESA